MPVEFENGTKNWRIAVAFTRYRTENVSNHHFCRNNLKTNITSEYRITHITSDAGNKSFNPIREYLQIQTEILYLFFWYGFVLLEEEI